MFKVPVLQTLYTLSDHQTEYQLKDRLSFMWFVGLVLHDPVRDAKTIGCTASSRRRPERRRSRSPGSTRCCETRTGWR
jgi:IS5 family transposase